MYLGAARDTWRHVAHGVRGQDSKGSKEQHQWDAWVSAGGTQRMAQTRALPTWNLADRTVGVRVGGTVWTVRTG